MNALQLLEEKISSLVAMIKELKEENKQFDSTVIALTKENEKLVSQYEQVAKEKAQLLTKVSDLEKKAHEGNDQISELNQEKALTKVAVDDLLDRLKSIDSLVEKQ